MKKILFSLLIFCLPFLAISQITINEVDPNQAGTDMAEFVELMGTPGASADGFVLVLFNGSDDASYDAIDLDGLVFDANGLLVINFPSNGLQNGADAVAVYMGDATDFPNDTPVTTTNLVDAVVYGTNDNDDMGLLTGLGETIQYNDDDATSIQADGAGGFVSATPTEGQPNDVTPPDCPDGSNIGDTCDDGMATTINDTVQADCSCVGTDVGLTDCGAFTWESVQVVNNSQTDVWTAIAGGWSMNGFVGGAQEQVDQWLVYGPIDVSATGSLFLNFDAAESFGVTDLNVVWTAAYPGCPADATWTNAATVTDSGVVSVDLSAVAGTAVFVAIEYSDDGADSYSSWDLTNFALLADVCPTPGAPMISMCTMTFDCPVEMVNFGTPCDDMDAATTNDVIQSDCTCAGTVPMAAELYISELSFNPCGDQGSDSNCEYIIITNAAAADADISGYSLANGTTFTFPAGTVIPAGGTLSIGASINCTGLDAFDLTALGDALSNSTDETVEILDADGALVSSVMYNGTFGDGNCDANCFDAIGTASECPSSLYNLTFDCPTEMVNFGDACDDMDAATTNDVIQADCTCAGTIPTFDCPTEMVNFGDTCDDMDAMTTNDVIQSDCTCAGVPIGGGTCPTTAKINEFHYDNAGTDVNEFIEIALPASSDPSSVVVTIYNGNGGIEYGTYTLTAADLVSTDGTNDYYVWNVSMQNGNDGIAVSCNGTVFQFITYEGAFDATDGPAAGMTGVDVGVEEPGDAAETSSIMCDGAGTYLANCTQDPGMANNTATCVADPIPGCTDMNACNYNPVATQDDGTCFNIGDACDDMDATTTNDVYTDCMTCAGTLSTMGCTDATACNFNPAATQDDGSCVFATGCDVCDGAGGVTDNPEVGEACDDGDATTSNDTVQADCSCVGTAPTCPTTAKINEFHYDNAGGDVNEFVEIALPAGSDPSGVVISLYNGSNGSEYDSYVLTSADLVSSDGTSDYYVWSPGSIQNGNDGIAVSCGGTVFQFITYEGAFDATDGPAAGMTGTDVGVEESSTGPETQSIMYDGAGYLTDCTADAGMANNASTCASNEVNCTPSIIQFPANPTGN